MYKITYLHNALFNPCGFFANCPVLIASDGASRLLGTYTMAEGVHDWRYVTKHGFLSFIIPAFNTDLIAGFKVTGGPTCLRTVASLCNTRLKLIIGNEGVNLHIHIKRDRSVLFGKPSPIFSLLI